MKYARVDQYAIGNNLARLRREMGMTQEMLAEKLSLNYRTISRWENGICLPDTQMWCILADLYCVPVGSLIIPREEMGDEPYSYIETISEKGNYAIHIDDMKECYPFMDFEFSHMMGIAKELKTKGFNVTHIHPYGFLIFIKDHEDSINFKKEIRRIVVQCLQPDGSGISYETQKKIREKIREFQISVMDEMAEELGVVNLCNRRKV